MKILFVCSSNVCRSPYCEFTFRRMLEDDDFLRSKNIEVSSAAVLNRSKEIFPKTVSALVADGFNAEELMSFVPCFKTQDKQRFLDADVIIGMSRFHKLLLPACCRIKYLTLSEAAEGKYTPIPDPFLVTSQERYDDAMDALKKYLYKYKNKLKEQLEKEQTTENKN